MAVFLVSLEPATGQERRGILLVPAILVISFAYGATLFSYTYRPPSLQFQSITPALFAILLTVTGISLWAGGATQASKGAAVDAP